MHFHHFFLSRFSRCLLVSLLLLTRSAFSQNIQQQIDSVMATNQHDTLKVNDLLEIGGELAMNADSTVLAVSDKGISLSLPRQQQAFYRNALSRFYVYKGIYWQFTGHYDEAKQWFQKGLELGEKFRDDKVITRSLGNLGNIANYQGDYTLAAEYGLRVLELSEKEGDDNNIAGALGNLANTYIRLNLYDRGIELLKRAIPLAQKTKDKRLEANLNNSLSIAYGELKQPDLELKYTQIAYDLYKELGNPKGIGTTALNLGMTWERRKDFTKALPYLQESIASSLAIEDNQNLAQAFQSMARIYEAQQRFKEAAAVRDSAILNSQIAGDRLLMAALYQEKAALLYRMGDFRNGYEYLERHRKLNDSLLNEDVNSKVAEMEVKYQTTKKINENQQLQARNKLILYCSVLALIALTVVFILFYRNRLIRQRFTEEVKLSKAVFETEQNERIRIARDMHDSIGQMLSVIRMRLSDPAANDTTVTARMLDEAVEEVRAISHNLLPEALNFGLVPALEELCQRSSVPGTVAVNIDVAPDAREYRFSPESQLSIYRIVQEVLSNMLRHSGATVIDLRISKSSDAFNFILADNGAGFETAQLEKSAGIGWKNIGARVRLLDGILHVRSQKQSGTTVHIEFPLK
jgi:signal transduction histidine kinase